MIKVLFVETKNLVYFSITQKNTRNDKIMNCKCYKNMDSIGKKMIF